jgi:hypothetical protein
VIKIARVTVTAVVSMRRSAVPTICCWWGRREEREVNDGGADRRSTREMSEERTSD